jgi:type I restriction enzyme M protein
VTDPVALDTVKIWPSIRVAMPLPAEFEKKLWAAADQLWTNSALSPSEYSTPVLALIFLKYADHRFGQAEKQLAGKARRRGAIGKDDYHGLGVLYVPEPARFRRLVELPEGADIGKAINNAMKAIEAENDELKDVLPKAYGRFGAQTLKELLKLFGTIPEDVEGDVFGRIYEYFLGNFAPRTLQKGGEYFTPYSVVRLIVEIVEPYHGRIFDPCCGSGGMFVQSASFIAAHEKKAADELSVFGVEKVEQTRRLARMNLAVHGLSGDIREANTYYEDIHEQVGRFDFVMANPPFNQNAVDRERIKDDKKRFPFGMPTTDNANYLWIQIFASALNDKGRAGFVMANSASDARGSELELRKKLIQTGAVDVMVTLSSNFFYTVTLPVTLWFLDKGKAKGKRKDEVLFIDARPIYRQVDRAHREFTAEQIEYLANIVRLWRGETVENRHGGGKMLKESFPKGKYVDVAGLCKVATLKEIEAQGWSLNPGRYVGVADRVVEDFDFKERLEELNEELERLNGEARELETKIAQNVAALLEA